MKKVETTTAVENGWQGTNTMDIMSTLLENSALLQFGGDIGFDVGHKTRGACRGYRQPRK